MWHALETNNIIMLRQKFMLHLPWREFTVELKSAHRCQDGVAIAVVVSLSQKLNGAFVKELHRFKR